jgi:hypothetical protein
MGRASTNKSPGTQGLGEFDDNDYSLSVSDLGNSVYNTSNGFGASINEAVPPRFKY